LKQRLTLLIVILLLASCGGTERDTETEFAVPVSVEEVELKSIEEFIVATGTVKSIEEVELKSEFSGFYHLLDNTETRRRFALGDIVKRGQDIIRLENPEKENEIKIKSQKLNLENSKREFEKQRSLYEKGGVTLGELKDAERSYMDAEYNYNNALILLSKLKITVPFDGIIVSLPYYTEAIKVEAGSPMVQIMNYSKLLLEVNLPAKDLEQLKVDQRVRVMSYSNPGDTLGGSVTQVSPAIDPDTHSFKTSINIDNPGLLLRPGMFVKTEIIVAHRDSAVVIPKDIILSKRRGKTVYVVERGTAHERTLITGLENPEEVEVIEGLKVNERLIVRGFETLRNRSKVKIIR
jgi:membrane fusion protein (multidrug efflux system)